MGILNRVLSHLSLGRQRSTRTDIDGDNEGDWAIPPGVDFRFIISSELTEEEKQGIAEGVAIHSPLTDVYQKIHTQIETFGERYPDQNDFDDSTTLVRVWCPESSVQVNSEDMDEFLQQVQDEFSTWFVTSLEEFGLNGEFYELLYVEMLG